MSEALITGLIGLGGVALGLVGNAALEPVRRTAARRDAAADRQAAVLREVQAAVGEYTREWAELINAVDRGEADLRTLPLNSPASVAGQRFRSLLESVTDDGLRQDLAEFSSRVFDRAASPHGSPRVAELWSRMNAVQSHVGRVLRRLGT